MKNSDGFWTRVHVDNDCGCSAAAEVADAPDNCCSRGRGGNGGGTGCSGVTLAEPVSLSSANKRAASNVTAVDVGCASACVSTTATQADNNSSSSKSDSIARVSDTTAASSHLTSLVTLPRRKPYLNLQSVTTGSGSSVINIYSSGSNLCENTEIERDIDSSSCRENLATNFKAYNIKRAHSFKDGLNEPRDVLLTRAFPLLRTQSYHDGLTGDFGDHHALDKPTLSRAPSIEEILESVKNLRVKKNMVKSTPDLYQNPCENQIHQTSSMSRNKSSKSSKGSRSAGPSGIIGVRYSSKPADHLYDRVPEPHYEQIIENSDPFYENLHKETHYENVNNKKKKSEVIYDRPRSNKLVENQYDQVQSDLHYENVQNYDLPVYENVTDNEPTYMNVKNANSSSRSKKSRSNKDTKTDSHKSSKSRQSSTEPSCDGLTYDIPRAATHIYDTPKKYTHTVEVDDNFSEYATPKNNRSVIMNSVDLVQLAAKQDQKQKIDDIFAEVDRDSLEEDYQPDIPPPGKKCFRHLTLKRSSVQY